jgi:DNA (cytosine-5)-methyltransferase 1
MTHLSLFTGIGGIDLAAEWAGFETVAMVERDKFCQQVLAKRFPNMPIYDDVTTFDGYKYEKEIDLLSAGFPCQPHSLAGKRKASGDERDLWGEVVRILGETKPRFFLGENVPGLLTSESGRFFGRILNDLESLGYSVGWSTYGAKDIGAVHRRNRVFIIAYSNVLRCNDLSNQEREQLKSRGETQCKSKRYDACFCGSDATNSKNLFCNGSSYQSSVSPLSESRDGNCSRVVGYSESESGLQTDTSSITERGRRNSRQNTCCGHWQGDVADSNGTRCKEQWGNISNESKHNPIKHGAYQSIKTGDWRQWGISPTVRLEPRVCGSNDGVPNRVDRLKALGNAVVPQQVYPILVEIARHLQTFDNQA